MSTEYQPETVSAENDGGPYSSFWPMVILIAALLGWSGYQALSAHTQASALEKEFKSAQPVITQAQAAQSRLYALAQDLIQTSAKDPYAAQIVKEANIQLNRNPNGDQH